MKPDNDRNGSKNTSVGRLLSFRPDSTSWFKLVMKPRHEFLVYHPSSTWREFSQIKSGLPNRDYFQTLRSNQNKNMRTPFDPEISEVSQAVLQALLEIHRYQSSHTVGEARSESIEALVASGVLSPEIVIRLANHQTRFHGFPSRISQDIPVLDVVLANRTLPLRIVGFADGHAAFLAVDKQV